MHANKKDHSCDVIVYDGARRLPHAPNEPTASTCVGYTTVKFFCHELYVHSMAAVPCRHQGQGRGPKHAESLESAAVKSDFSVAAVVAPGGGSASASASV